MKSGDPFDPTRGADVVVFQSVSTDSVVHDCTLSIHHGSVAGPILAQMLIRVYPVKLVVVQIHRIRIRGVAPTTSAAQMDTVFGSGKRNSSPKPACALFWFEMRQANL